VSSTCTQLGLVVRGERLDEREQPLGVARLHGLGDAIGERDASHDLQVLALSAHDGVRGHPGRFHQLVIEPFLEGAGDQSRGDKGACSRQDNGQKHVRRDDLPVDMARGIQQDPGRPPSHGPELLHLKEYSAKGRLM
jgi:hypothetical protein